MSFSSLPKDISEALFRRTYLESGESAQVGAVFDANISSTRTASRAVRVFRAFSNRWRRHLPRFVLYLFSAMLWSPFVSCEIQDPLVNPPPKNLPICHELSQTVWVSIVDEFTSTFFHNLPLFPPLRGFGADQRPTRSARPVVVRMARRPFHGFVKMTSDASALMLDPHQERWTRSSPSSFLWSSSSPRGNH